MSPSKRGDDKLITLGASPRADLLPPELKAEVRFRAQRRLMGGIVVLAIALVVGAYLYTFVNAATNEARLAASNATTQTLATQKAEYIEVTQLQTQIDKSTAAQIVGTSTEVNWKSYITLVQASLPAGANLTSISAKTTAPGVPAEVATTPLLQPSIVSIEFAARTPTLPDVSAWIENLSKIPGFADATAGTITLRDDGQYDVSMLLHLNEKALSNRFLTPPDSATDDTTDDENQTEETTP